MSFSCLLSFPPKSLVFFFSFVVIPRQLMSFACLLSFPLARRRAAAKKMKGLSKDSSKEEEELDDMEMVDPFSDLQVTT